MNELERAELAVLSEKPGAVRRLCLTRVSHALTYAIEKAKEDLASLGTNYPDKANDQLSRIGALTIELGWVLDELDKATDSGEPILATLESWEPPGRPYGLYDFDGSELTGKLGGWEWELAHGSETVVVKLTSPAGTSRIMTQAEPLEVLTFANALLYQAEAVTEYELEDTE